MERYTRLNKLVRKSFRHLNRVQTKTAFVRHYFLVMELNVAHHLEREMQFNSRRDAARREYASI